MAHFRRPAARVAALAFAVLAGCAGAESALRRCDAGSGSACLEAASELPGKLPSDRARAIALRAKACEQGVKAECLRAGFAYAHGVEVRLDLERAGALLEQGCKANDFDACSYAGALLVPLPGFLGDGVRALRLFEFACHNGSAAGCYNAARRYERGDVEGADPDRAAQFFRRAADLAKRTCGKGAKSGLDCYALGYMAEHGRGVPKDLARSAAAYRSSCDAGEPFGCVKWASAIERGDVAPPEPDEDDPAARAALLPEAIRARACDAGAWDGCELLAESVREGGSAFGRDFGVWLSAACAHGSGRACGRMAGEVRRDDARSAAFLRGGCDARDAASCAKLAQRHLDGKGVPPSTRRAAELLGRLCTAGDRQSCRAASRLAAGTRDAHALLERACGLGDAAACGETAGGFRPAVAR